MTIPTYPEHAAGVKQIIGLEQQIAGLVSERDYWKERAGTLEAANTRLTFAATANAETYRATQATCDALRAYLVRNPPYVLDGAPVEYCWTGPYTAADPNDAPDGDERLSHALDSDLNGVPYHSAADEMTDSGYTYRELTEALAVEVTA
jgi:hypothetical protein